MKILKMAVSGVLLTALMFPWSGKAAEDREPAPPPQSMENPSLSSAPNPALPRYRPPMGAMPGCLLKGGSRGGKEFPVLQVLAPNHVGQTRYKQPVVYWYLSKVTTYPIEFTLVDSRAIQPIIETRLRPPTQAGVQRISLRDYGVSLDESVPYRWFVTLMIDPSNPSKDVTAGAIIERTDYF
jgi:hypothetical protein